MAPRARHHQADEATLVPAARTAPEGEEAVVLLERLGGESERGHLDEPVVLHDAISEYVAKVIATAPPLTGEARSALAALLAGDDNTQH